MKSIAKIIITEQAIPYEKNGSWSQRLEYFLKSDYNVIDYFICGKTNQSLDTTTTFFREKQVQSKWMLKLFPKTRYQHYTNRLEQIVNQHSHSVICVVDNVKLMLAISECIEQKKLKQKITLLFYCCGHSYFLEDHLHKKFLKNCDEFIFLTQSAYTFNKARYEEFVPEVTVLNNPINKTLYKPIEASEKESLIELHQLSGKNIFLWLSHDRPKKGLSVVLNAWKDSDILQNEAVLLVVGAKRNISMKGVLFIGQVESNKVIDYYNMAHVYLFPTMWKEGFGLSLAQAICCGCYCIAADNGGVADFFTTNDGVLIQQPNIVSHWTQNMEKALNVIEQGWVSQEPGNQILDYTQWSQQFASIFTKWENRFHKE
ncbi:glycosyltransferase [Flavobacterium sp.]|jgi:glycosyltransferase involved in cell wall biosynthesis|uniref:glycosyltransferase n=1 Tax=Flavobacterium sp. TaxID=239 RepID=UPI002A7FA11A|nr:glycosyltransferase [Flavobacterium sp.]